MRRGPQKGQLGAVKGRWLEALLDQQLEGRVPAAQRKNRQRLQGSSASR